MSGDAGCLYQSARRQGLTYNELVSADGLDIHDKKLMSNLTAVQ
jgi:hypothetical protein